MRYDTLHPLVLVNLSINACTEKKTEGVKDCAETFVRQSCNICIFAPYVRETVIFLYGLHYLYYFVGTIAEEFIYPHTCNVLHTYKYDIILSHSLARFSCSQ